MTPAEMPGPVPAAVGDPIAEFMPAESAAPPAAAERGPTAVAGVRDGLDAAALGALLAAAFPSGTACRHYTARLDAIGPLASGLPADPAAWAEGRVWSARAEVRWQRAAPARFSALYLGVGETLPAELTPLAPDLQVRPGEDDGGVYLWGRRGADGRYRTTRLPRPLEYPALGGAAEPRLAYQRLVDADGAVRFLRLTLEEGA